MATTEKPETICKSVFKSGENTTSISRFTKKWIELINKTEQTKGRTAVRQAVRQNRSTTSSTASSTAKGT